MRKTIRLSRRLEFLAIYLGLILLTIIFGTVAFRNEKYNSKEFSVIINTRPLTDLTKSQPVAGVQNPELPAYAIEIPKINIKAPVIINIDGNNKDLYMKALENGVAHLDGSVLPGESGNTVIFGHSSYYSYKPGNYKDIFAKLNDLASGDRIVINANGKSQNFTVTEKKVVQPENVEVAYQNFQKKILTLITCWPIGTIDKRLVIVSTLDGS